MHPALISQPNAEASTEAPASRFEFRDLLGRGGMGEVYRAWDRELEIDVALKSLRPGVGHDARVLARFRREAKLARRIKHVNVAQMYDLIEIDGARYLAMEFVDGKSLRSILDAKRSLPPHVAMGIIRQVCSGVQAAHDVGVIHRDLKPHNIMITRRHGRACILDFGIARELGAQDHTEAGVILGSPQYLSPEQLEGQPATFRSDVYQIGILLFELLTGLSPFRAPGASTGTLRALREIPPDPRQYEPRLPGFMVDAILRCLSRYPEDRFASPMDLVKWLDGHRSALPIPEATSTLETDSGSIEIGVEPTVLVAAAPSAERTEIVDRLERLGCAVTTSDDGLTAVDLAYSRRFTLVIVDAALPQLDGLTACQVMQRSPTCSATSVLVVLRADDAGREAFARQVGAADIIHTPLNVHAFSRTVRRLLTL